MASPRAAPTRSMTTSTARSTMCSTGSRRCSRSTGCAFFRSALERTVTERSDELNHLLLHVALRVEFTLTSVDDGSSHKVEAYGEALDGGDKATAKAMSAAYKAAMVQTFCIPVAEPRMPTAPAIASSRRPTVPSRSRAGRNGVSTSRISSACARASRRSRPSRSATAIS